jgi:hypothetical protein
MFPFGDTVIVPDLQARVTVLDGDNNLLAQLGDTPDIWDTPGWPNLPAEKFQPGHFSSPHGACADSHGDIYVAEWVSTGRLTKLKKS